jgi:acyl carrier protein
MDRQAVLDKLLAFFADRVPEESAAVSEATPLRDVVLLDSLAFIEAIMFLEEEFELSVERADLDRFDTPAGMADLILEKLPGRV